MTTELKTLRTFIRKKLRRSTGNQGGKDSFVDGEVLLKAINAGLSVKGELTLEQLSDMVDARLQAEVLALYQRKEPPLAGAFAKS